jgi:hypothetical protein
LAATASQCSTKRRDIPIRPKRAGQCLQHRIRLCNLRSAPTCFPLPGQAGTFPKRLRKLLGPRSYRSLEHRWTGTGLRPLFLVWFGE